MLGIWRTSTFGHMTDQDQWRADVADDHALAAQIAAGAFVPINVGGNGTFRVLVRGADSPGRFVKRERTYLLASSEPYLLISDGALELGGIECVGGLAGGETTAIPLDSGRYGVVVHSLDWQAEPGSHTANGEPSRRALADLLVEIYVEPDRLPSYAPGPGEQARVRRTRLAAAVPTTSRAPEGRSHQCRGADPRSRPGRAKSTCGMIQVAASTKIWIMVALGRAPDSDTAPDAGRLGAGACVGLPFRPCRAGCDPRRWRRGC
jgi:hypothetical protein